MRTFMQLVLTASVFAVAPLSMCWGGGSEVARRERPGGAMGKTILVEGEVMDGDGLPIPRDEMDGKPGESTPVTILVLDGKNVEIWNDKSTKLDPEGYNYHLKIPEEKLPRDLRQAFTLVFTHPRWQPQAIPLLSGKNKYQSIDYVLADPNGPRDYLDIIHQITVYEYLYAAASGSKNPTTEVDKLIKEYQDRVKGIPHPLLPFHQRPKDPKKPTKQALAIEAMKKTAPHQLAIIQEKLTALYKLYRIPNPALAQSMPCPPPTIIYYYPIVECYPPVYYGPSCVCRPGVWYYR
jgi:hypothetical protein